MEWKGDPKEAQETKHLNILLYFILFFCLGSSYIFLKEGVSGEKMFCTLTNQQIYFFLNIPLGSRSAQKQWGGVVSVSRGFASEGIKTKSLLQSDGNTFRERGTCWLTKGCQWFLKSKMKFQRKLRSEHRLAPWQGLKGFGGIILSPFLPPSPQRLNKAIPSGFLQEIWNIFRLKGNLSNL